MRRTVLLVAGAALVVAAVTGAISAILSSGPVLAPSSGAPRTSGSGQTEWVIRDLGTLGGKWSKVFAINGRGQIVGSAGTKARDAHGVTVYRAFLWENGRMRDLGTLGGPFSEAWAINERGQIVGSADTKAFVIDPTHGDPMYISHAVLWTLRSG